MFLRNAWYVAAWDEELGTAPLPRTILGERIVLFRGSGGSAAAMEDACPHRRLPLSMGRIVGDRLQCGYHGMEFDGTGKCRHIPGQTIVPPDADIRAYPLIPRWGLLWIWMGEPELADPAAIMEVEHFGEAGWGINRGPAIDVPCEYQLMTDNLVDPSHVSYVHPTTLGNASTVGIPVKTEARDRRIIVTRWMMDAEPAPFYAPHLKFSGNTDRLQHYEVRLPSSCLVKIVIVPAGHGGTPAAAEHPAALLMDSYNLITPVDEDNCRYYWFQMRNFDAESEDISRQLTAGFEMVFGEDVEVLAEVHRGMKAATKRPIDLALDRGSNIARRTLKKLVAEEQQQVPQQVALQAAG